MKTQKLEVVNYIYDVYNERGTKNFERTIHTLLKRNDVTGSVICLNAYMERGNGNGSYYKVAEIQVDNEIYTLRERTNDSELWDNWQIPNSKDKRNMFFAVLESEIKALKRDINQEF